jgi:ribokinase
MTLSASTPRIAVVGSYGVGLTMTLARVPRAGETVLGTSFSQGPGGKGSNQAIAAARLGAQVALCSIVGDDVYGAQAHALWRAEGVATGGVVTGSRATMAGFILVEPDGENRIAIAPGVLDELAPTHVAAFAPEIGAADVLLTCLEIPVAAVHEALRTARAAGVATVLNPAPAMPIDDASLALADHLTPNRTEAAALCGADPDASPDALLDALRARKSGGVIVLTLGAAGALVDDGATRTAVPARAVEVVDTTGAGDAFSAAYAVSIAEGSRPREAAELASACGAFAVTRAEVLPGLPRRHELAAVAQGP